MRVARYKLQVFGKEGKGWDCHACLQQAMTEVQAGIKNVGVYCNALITNNILLTNGENV